MRSSPSILFATVLAAAAVATGCGSSVTCGADTREENGQCVAQTLAKCPAGQALNGSECKPLCGTGTVFKNGACVLGDAVCGAGTELVGDQCKMIDPLARVTVHEADEPNDTATKAARFTLPGIGEAAAVLGGVIGEVHDSKADFDGFVFTAQPGQRVRIAATAVGAPTVGVVLQPVDPAHPDALTRYIASFAERGATRELTLPTGGDWIIKVSETSNFNDLVSSVPRGGANFTYTVEVTQLAAPAAKSLTVPGNANGSLVTGEVYDVPGNGETVRIAEITLATPEGELPFNGLRMLWAADSAGHLLLDEHDEVSTSGTLKTMGTVRLVVPPGGAKLGVDYVVDLGAGGNYTLAAGEGSMEEIALPFDGTRDLTENGAKLFAFDVPANAIIDIAASNIGYDVDFKMELRDSQFQLVASDTGYFSSDIKAMVPAGKEGRYFLVALDTDFQESDTDLDFRISIKGSDVAAVGPVDVPGDGAGQAQAAGTSPAAYFAVYTKADAMLSLRATGEAGMQVAAKALSTKFQTIAPLTNTGTEANIQDLYVKAGVPLIVQVNADHAGAVNLEVATVVPNLVPEIEPNDSRTQAQVLSPAVGASADVMAELASETDSDYYTFTLADAADVTLATRAGLAGGAPDTYLNLYDANGTKLETNDDGGPGLFSLITKTALPAGQYYVEVTTSPYADPYDATGDYVFSVKVAAPTP